MKGKNVQNQEHNNEQTTHIFSMAKNLFRKEKYQERGVRPHSFLNKFLNRLSAVLLFFFVIFIWSSSTIIISGSIVHVCVRSRKLNSPYCLSVGTSSDSETPLYSFSNSSVVKTNTDVLVDNNTRKSPEISPIRPSTVAVSTQSPATEEVKNVNQKLEASSPISTSQELVTTQVTESEFTKLVLRDGVDKEKAEEKVNSRKAVEDQIAILRSYTSKSKPSNCEGRGIYVYDLPSKFNYDLVAKCYDMMPWLDFCKFLSNDAMGEPIPDLGKGWYNTNQFSLEPIFHRRILSHPCRVQKPEQAKVFYVPFYGALDMIRCHFNRVKSAVNDSNVLSTELVKWLEQQKMWKRNFGLDHVFVLGKITWDFRRVESVPWGSPLLELGELQNPIKLLIERQPWKINEVGVPYPTYFHPSTDEEITSWQKLITQVERRNLIGFAGTPHNQWENIRSILIEQCTSSPKVCNFLNCSGEACVESSPVISLFAESEFCLQPPGDSPTRKSMFDSIIVGCIPVVFDPFTAHYQYPWHLPEDYKKYSVFIDEEAVKMSEVNVIEKLVKIPLKERQEIRKYIIDELMPRVIYANADAKLEKFEDAIIIAVNNLLQMAISRLP